MRQTRLFGQRVVRRLEFELGASSDSARGLSRRSWLRALAMLGIGVVVGCGTASTKKATTTAPASRPAKSIGQPAPKTITATRSFVVTISGDVLAARQREAAKAVPLAYTYLIEPAAYAATKRRYLRDFARWARTIARLRIGDLASFTKAHTAHGKLFGVHLPKKTFDRLRRVPPARLIATFSLLVRRAMPPYVVKSKGLAERKVANELVYVRRGGKKAREKKAKQIKLTELRDLDALRAELLPLATQPANKLEPQISRDLVALVRKLAVPTLALDRERMRSAWQEARAKVDAKPLQFIKGQTIIREGEILSAETAAIVAIMRSVRCEPCAATSANCGAGLILRMRLGGTVGGPIRATRTFAIPLDAERWAVLRKQASDGVTRVFLLDPAVGRAREKTLQRIFQQARRLPAPKRLAKIRDSLEEALQVKLVAPAFDQLSKVPMAHLRDGLLALYRATQAQPIIGTPPGLTRPCVLRQVKGPKAGKLHARCPTVPLARLRLDLPLRAGRYISLLAKMPDPAQRAVIELVQQLLAVNTTFDKAETERRQAKAAAAATGEARFYRKGDIVFPAGQGMTRVDRHTLQRMYSRRCVPVSHPR